MTGNRKSPPGQILFSDLPDHVKAKVKSEGKAPRKTRVVSLTKEQVRGHAIRCLNQIADLSDSDRDRVLNMALKINGV